MTNVNKLKPCPFCGGSDLFVDSDDFYNSEETKKVEMKFIHCYDCNAHGPCEYTEEQALELWSTRIDKGGPVYAQSIH